MKISAQEEYGLRILLQIAKTDNKNGLTISDISTAEGITSHNVAKLCRILRMAGFIKSSRGKGGGYALARSAQSISIADVLNVLGGRLFESDFCSNHSGSLQLCTNSVDCSIRSLWQVLQVSIDNVLNSLSLQDLIASADGPLYQISGSDEKLQISPQCSPGTEANRSPK